MSLSFIDAINGSFESLGGILCWINVRRLIHDKYIVGISWHVQGFFSLWGLWNLIYYSSLNQPFSFFGGILLVLGNSTWMLLAIKYLKKETMLWQQLQ